MAEKEVPDSEVTSAGPAPESFGRPRSRLKTMIMGVGVILIVIGVALATYAAIYEEEAFMIALAPAFIGVIVIIAALFGKKL